MAARKYSHFSKDLSLKTLTKAVRAKENGVSLRTQQKKIHEVLCALQCSYKQTQYICQKCVMRDPHLWFRKIKLWFHVLLIIKLVEQQMIS